MNLKTTFLIVALVVFPIAAQAITIDLVPVGNPGNPGELSGSGAGGYGPDRICGAVNYNYQIGKYEITTGQYCEFLNAVATIDTYELYNTNMDTAINSYGCNIKRSGPSWSYTYSVSSDWSNRPVNYVSWGDAARFANWLSNSQPGLITPVPQDMNSTEDGSYLLDGAMSCEALMAVTRKPTATWVIPTEDEWYKAAYHMNEGLTGNYFDYPTSSDSAPSNILGNPTDPGNNATYWINGYAIGSPYYRTEVGDHENSDSPYGTYDQGGNVFEWNEIAITNSWRGLRGGSINDPSNDLSASNRDYGTPTDERYSQGFRIACVPEPGSLMMLAGIALTGLLFWNQRHA